MVVQGDAGCPALSRPPALWTTSTAPAPACSALSQISPRAGGTYSQSLLPLRSPVSAYPLTASKRLRTATSPTTQLSSPAVASASRSSAAAQDFSMASQGK